MNMPRSPIAGRACNDRPVEEVPPPPCLRVRAVGKLLSASVAVAPGIWPALRRPVIRFFDSAAGSWDSRTSAGTVAHLEALAVALDRVGRDPERVLDLGCGTGETTLFLAREYPRAGIRGADISPEMIRRARRKTGLDPSARISFRVADASDLPWETGSFDLIAQVNMPVFATEARRVLRGDGCLVVVSSLGEKTPFDTPSGLLDRALRRAGFSEVERGRAGRGTWLVARAGKGRDLE